MADEQSMTRDQALALYRSTIAYLSDPAVQDEIEGAAARQMQPRIDAMNLVFARSSVLDQYIVLR